MQDPGMRRLYVARDCKELARTRQNLGKQEALQTKDLSLSTLSRVERGARVLEKTARAITQLLAPGEPVETLFKLSSERGGRTEITWENICQSAAQIGKAVFREFKPDFVITFAGPPALFTSLSMMKSLNRNEVLRTTFYTALYRNKWTGTSLPKLRGYETIETHRFLLHIPLIVSQISSRSEKRVCVFECTVTTGSNLERIKKYLIAKGYSAPNIKYACCVCEQETYSNPYTRPDFCTYKVREPYRLPWGDPL